MIYIIFDNTVWSGLVWSELKPTECMESWNVYCLLLGNLSSEINEMNSTLEIAPESRFLAAVRPSSATIKPL